MRPDNSAASVTQAAPLQWCRHTRCWQGQRESNPQPSVLETDALPIELCPYSRRLVLQLLILLLLLTDNQ